MLTTAPATSRGIGRMGAARFLQLLNPGFNFVKPFGSCLVLLVPVFKQGLVFLGKPLVFGGGFLGKGQGLGFPLVELRLLLVPEFHTGLDPLPALGAQLHGFGFKLLQYQAVKQGRIEKEDTLVAFREEIAPYRASGLLVGRDGDEPRTLVAGADIVLGKHSADVMRFMPVLQCAEHVFLRRVVVGDGEGLHLLQTEIAFTVTAEPPTSAQVAEASGRVSPACPRR